MSRASEEWRKNIEDTVDLLCEGRRVHAALVAIYERRIESLERWQFWSGGEQERYKKLDTRIEKLELHTKYLAKLVTADLDED